ncbi:hypothetical protein [Halosimplex sp. TS25]|uniref:DUF7857 domain-containing protein n=1 Tax=Halosimplex rarum TaxID=3396619 RepID=UPI0039ED9545
MVTLDWSLERSDGVTLVGLVVAAERPCRVRVENRLDGPVWPPRRRGQPADGWEDGAFTGEVSADGRLTIGYATPASPEEPPAEVVATEPATDPGRGGTDETARASPVPAVDSTPAGVVRALGNPVVPRDGVPVPDACGARPGGTSDGSLDSERTTGRDEDREPVDGPDSATTSAHPGSRRSECPGASDRAPEAERLVVPSGVRAWLRDVEARLDAAEGERGCGADRQTAESALASARATDRQALRRVRRRADALLARVGEGPDRGSTRRDGTDADGDAVGR